MEKSKEVTVTTLGAASMCLSAFSLGMSYQQINYFLLHWIFSNVNKW